MQPVRVRLFHPDGPSLGELARQALSSVEQGYDLLAPRFDHTPFRTPDALIVQTLAFAEELSGSAVDLCCGTGAAALELARRGVEVTGIDMSEEMLAVAREQNSNIRWRKGDVLNPPQDLWGQFDLAVSFGAFGHFERHELPALMLAVRRLLRPDGRFIFATTTAPAPWSRTYWVARGFNAVMRVRNAVWSPPFVMYYLGFHLPVARALLEDAGFSVRAKTLGQGVEPGAARVVAMVATRR